MNKSGLAFNLGGSKPQRIVSHEMVKSAARTFATKKEMFLDLVLRMLSSFLPRLSLKSSCFLSKTFQLLYLNIHFIYSFVQLRTVLCAGNHNKVLALEW